MIELLLRNIKRIYFPFYVYLKYVKKERRCGLKMLPLYADGMILQCNKPLRIQGQARSGEWVTVRIASQMQQTCCQSDDRWEVLLEAIIPGGPYQMEISTSKKRLLYKDVYAGEVWLCSGQSNMVAPLSELPTKDRDTNERIPYRYLYLYPLAPTFPNKWVWGVNQCVNRYRYISYSLRCISLPG